MAPDALGAKEPTMLAREVMTSPVVSIGPEASVKGWPQAQV